MKSFIIEAPQAQQLLNYLAKQPYQEVFQLITILQGLEEKKEDEDE